MTQGAQISVCDNLEEQNVVGERLKGEGTKGRGHMYTQG